MFVSMDWHPQVGDIVCFVVFNATFHNISVISWPAVLLVEETGVRGETIDWHNHNCNIYVLILI